MLGGTISFSPSLDIYGKGTGKDDYLYSIHYYSGSEMKKYLEPDEFAARTKIRALFMSGYSLVGFMNFYFLN